MDDYYGKRSGQIPAFGDWDYTNELPITQYFECARQAGLIRFSSSSGESDLHADLYAVDINNKKIMKKPNSRNVAHPNPRKTIGRGREKRYPHVNHPHVKEQKKQSKVCDDVAEPIPRKLHYQYHHTRSNDAVLRPIRPPKPVDEDLYKISPELLHTTTKRKKMLGLFSCLVPACAS